MKPLAQLLDLSGRRAVVTGAAQGFGAAIAARLAEAGAEVVAADLNAPPQERVDVADAASVAALFDRVGPVDVLVNNAGVFSNYYVQALPPAEFERILRVNVLGAFHCAQAAVRGLLAAGRRGCIVNVASVDAVRGSAEGLSHYTTSKHALAGLTRSLAMELAPNGIRVNAVCPGAAMTEGAVAFVQAGSSAGIDLEAQWDGIRERTPLGRLCDPDDVARAVLFLASDLAEFVTGVLLPVDGGILVQPLEGYVPAAAPGATLG